MKLKGNCIIAQSGGPTAVINASAYGVIKTFLETDPSITVYGGVHGVQGILEGNLHNVTTMDPNVFAKLPFMPSAAFGSCRYKLADESSTTGGDYARLLDIFKKFDIKYFFYIGGNDSMDSCYKIDRMAREAGIDLHVMGVPKTIDNDLEITDHCPGFGSAAKYVANTTAEVYYDISSYPKKQIAIIEAMGRDTGWLTASSALAARKIGGMEHLIYLPEVFFDDNRFIKDVEDALTRSRYVMIVASEGIRYENGHYINIADVADSFGHVKLGGIGKTLRRMIKSHFDIDVRALELNVMQRCAMHAVSGNDLREAELAGRTAAQLAIDGETGYMAALVREPGEVYSCGIQKAPLSEVRNRVKYFPKEWVGENLCSIKEGFYSYAAPLIAGKVDVFDDDGLINCQNMMAFRK